MNNRDPSDTYGNRIVALETRLSNGIMTRLDSLETKLSALIDTVNKFVKVDMQVQYLKDKISILEGRDRTIQVLEKESELNATFRRNTNRALWMVVTAVVGIIVWKVKVII